MGRESKWEVVGPLGWLGALLQRLLLLLFSQQSSGTVSAEDIWVLFELGCVLLDSSSSSRRREKNKQCESKFEMEWGGGRTTTRDGWGEEKVDLMERRRGEGMKLGHEHNTEI